MPAQATVTLRGLSPYSASRLHNTPKLPKEAPDVYDQRTWLEHCYFDKEGNVCIPAISIKYALMQACSFDSEKIAGKGGQTYKTHFTSGVLINEDKLPIGINRKDICPDRVLPDGEPNPHYIEILAHASGDRDAKKQSRVIRRFPIFETWSVHFTATIGDSFITEDIFRRYLTTVGKFLGLGRWRLSKGGNNGQFEVANLVWEGDHAAKPTTKKASNDRVKTRELFAQKE
jgi:hypothetical protein